MFNIAVEQTALSFINNVVFKRKCSNPKENCQVKLLEYLERHFESCCCNLIIWLICNAMRGDEI